MSFFRIFDLSFESLSDNLFFTQQSITGSESLNINLMFKYEI
jgi:hypothetical protein